MDILALLVLCVVVALAGLFIADELRDVRKKLGTIIDIENERNEGEVAKREHLKNIGLNLTQFNQEFKGVSNTLRRIADKNKD